MAEAAPTAISSSPCHLGGLTRVCFAPDGQTIFTGGSDCLVRIHKANDPDSEPGFHDNHEDAVTSLSCAGSNLITASLDNIARTFSYPGNEYTGYVTRSSSVPIRWVSLDKAGERVAVCSDDLLVKVVHVNDTTRVSLLSDNTKSVRSATWDPSGKYLSTVACDGKIKIYDMSDSTPLLLKIIEGVVASSEPDSNVSCYAAWNPSGTCFAVPTRTNEIAIINKDGWTRQTTLSPDGPKSLVGELAWSPNGRYLAAAAGSRISIWTMDTRQIITRYTNPEGSITGLVFSPISNFIAFTSSDGSFSRWTDPIPSSFISPIASDAVQAKTLDKLLDDEFGDEDDLNIEERGEDIADDWIVDDEGDGAYARDDDDVGYTRGRREVVNVTKAQPPFAPGSTLMRNKKRYLAFNMIGVIDVTDQETHQVINVEFHDKSARRGYHFQDHHKYTMASLGEQGIVYASASDGDEPSQVYYRPYDSWASQSDWTISLLPGEEALVVAAGGEAGDGMGSVVVATTKGYVRFLSSSGIQRYLWRVGEEVVTMVAGKEAVMLVRREGGTSLDGCQNLRYSIIDLETFELIQEGRVPIPRKVLLSWVGFSRDGVPAIFDSTGLLSVLDRYRRPGQARWVPLLDTSSLAAAGRTETYWPVGLTETHFTTVILRGGAETEPWFPRPLIQEVDMRMPVLNMDNEQGKREEAAMRSEIYISRIRDSIDLGSSYSSTSDDLEYTLKQREIALDKELLQLVQGACKADNLQRALDLSRLMHNPASVEAAAKIAGFYHLPGLQERMAGVRVIVDKKKKNLGSSSFSRNRGGRERENYTPAPAANGNGNKGFTDFAPRATARRSFGGKVRDRDSTPATMTNTAAASTYIPETPRMEIEPSLTPAPMEMPMSFDETPTSPDVKRKRGDEENFAPVSKRGDPSSAKEPAKNPFAKKSGGNPFAKPAIAKPLDAIKSTSFFERVDTIESSGGGGPTSTKPRPKAKKDGQGQGKQQTLFGLKGQAQAQGQGGRPSLAPQESMAMTETDPDLDRDESMDMANDNGVEGEAEEESEELQEAQGPVSVDVEVEESMEQERAHSPDWDETQDEVEI